LPATMLVTPGGQRRVRLRSMTNQAIMFRSMVSAGADDLDLERFVRAFRCGPQTPEPGAACTGGVGEPT
jgi:hypothetical protein